MTIKLDDPEQKAADLRILDEAESDLRKKRLDSQEALFQGVCAIIPDDMALEDANAVFLRLLAVGIMQVHTRVKGDAINAAVEVGKLIPKILENEWGSPGHQNLLKNRSQEVN